MALLVRFFRLLSIVIWVGGIAFFAFVLAPVAFGSLGSAHEAGLVVRKSLIALDWVGITCGMVFLGATVFLGRRRVEIVLVAGMIVGTVALQFYVIPKMEVNRAGGAIETMDIGDARRVDFERLHVLSERLEGAVLLLGLGVIGAMTTGE